VHCLLTGHDGALGKILALRLGSARLDVAPLRYDSSLREYIPPVGTDRALDGVVLHLGAASSRGASIEEVREKNVIPAFAMRDFLSSHPNLGVIFISAASIFSVRPSSYGDFRSFGSFGAYEMSKLLAESIFSEPGLASRAAIFRCPAVYGLSQHTGLIVRLFREALSDGSVTICSPNKLINAGVSADDLINFIIRKIDVKASDNRSFPGQYFLGFAPSITLEELGRKVAQLIGADLRITINEKGIDASMPINDAVRDGFVATHIDELVRLALIDASAKAGV
jgi:nucleoside-diphosphate-sugar epimerase